MCGIIGYTGFRSARQVVLDGLATLEYRGYDSAGAAFLTDKICLFKTSGRVSDLAKITPDVHSHTGIGIRGGQLTANPAKPTRIRTCPLTSDLPWHTTE